MTTHVREKHHKNMAKASSSSLSVSSFFRPHTSLKIIEAESIWSKFVAMHKISFQASDHATKLFHQIWRMPRNFPLVTQNCGNYQESIVHTLSIKTFMDKPKFFSLLMDESNDTTDKSCIILVRLLDSDEGDVRTRFLDMPIVNIGMAQNLFRGLKESLSSKGLEFSKCLVIQQT